MKTDGHDFLEQLAAFPPTSFEGRFLKLSTRLRLAQDFSANELSLLYGAAFRAALCSIAFNGLGGCDSELKPDQEPHRTRLEQDFMDARSKFLACPGWQALSNSRKDSVQRTFLKVEITEENLTQ
jgi:hypothetical protein